MLLTDKKKFQQITKIPWFCIYFTQNENGKLIFELPYTARVRMFLFWPALKDRTHKQTDISFSTEIQAELDDPFKPWKNRSKSDDFTESNKKFKNLIIVYNLKPYGFLKQNVLYYDLKSNTVQNKSQISLAVELCTTHRWTSNKMHSLWSVYSLFNNFKSSFVYLFHNQIQYIVVCRDRFRFYRLHHFDRCSDEGRDLTGRHTSSLWTPWYSYSWTLSHRPYRSHHSDRDPTHTWWCLLNSCGQYNLQFYNKLSKGIWNNYIHSY